MAPELAATPDLNAALAKVQAELPTVAKNQVGEVRGTTKDGKPYSYDYKYADLDAVSDAIIPLLGKNGLSFTCEPAADEQDRLVLDYALLHESGQERQKQFPLWTVMPPRVTAQTIGGLITFFRRYCLCAVTGVAPGGDSDAAGAAEVDASRRPPPPPVEPPENHPGSADPAAIRRIQAAYTKLKFDSRSDRVQILDITSQLVGRPLTGPDPRPTHRNLSFAEARTLAGILEGLRGDRGALVERLNTIRDSAEAATAHAAAEDAQEEL